MKKHNGPIIFFWDELPLMLQKIARDSSETDAMDVLDTLRSVRQTHDQIRMVYTGSIGMHHVTSALRKAGHQNDATNDMLTEEVPPLSTDDARHLATELLRGEAIACNNLTDVAAEIAESVDGVPFYIHHVVSALNSAGATVDCESVRSIVANALVDSQDTWHLEHYAERLAEYYGHGRVPVVHAILDVMSGAREPLPLDTLAGRLGAVLAPTASEEAKRVLGEDKEPLRYILTMLQSDHYLRREPAHGGYMFKFPLIKRWWGMRGGISC